MRQSSQFGYLMCLKFVRYTKLNDNVVNLALGYAFLKISFAKNSSLNKDIFLTVVILI